MQPRLSAGSCSRPPIQHGAVTPCPHRPWHARSAARRPRSRTAQLRARAAAYTQPALHAIRAAQAEACRQGSMFLAPPHLLQGLLQAPEGSACALLNAAGVSAASAEAALVDPEMLPRSSSMRLGELHWAPDARAVLDAAAAAAQAAGQQAAGTPHLLLGVLGCKSGPVVSLLQGTGIELAPLIVQVEAAVQTCSEPAAEPQQQAPPAEAQAAALVQQYKDYVARHGGSAPPPAGAAAWQQQQQGTPAPAGNRPPPPQPPAWTPEDDDIYE